MQPKLCTKCKKNIAVIFMTKIENGVTMNEGFCLRCARSLGIPQIDAAVKQMGFSDEDLDTLSDEMSNMFGQRDDSDDMDDDAKLKGAQKVYDSIMNTFTGLSRLMQSAQAFAKQYGYTETILGRRRHLPDMQLPLQQAPSQS